MAINSVMLTALLGRAKETLDPKTVNSQDWLEHVLQTADVMRNELLADGLLTSEGSLHDIVKHLKKAERVITLDETVGIAA